MGSEPDKPTLPTHGASHLSEVEVDSYNLEIADGDGFVGDKASKAAFRDILEELRAPLRNIGEDPFGDTSSEDIRKKKLDAVLTDGSPEAAGVVQGAIEEFAQQFAKVIRRFLKAKAWQDTECIVVGGGFRGRRVGELAIGRCAVILKSDDLLVDIELIRHDPDEAGLIGAAHLLPAWMLAGYEGMLTVDVGGTNIRAGVVELNQVKAKDFSKASVWNFELWRHRDEDIKRDKAVDRLVDMLTTLGKRAHKSGLRLAPLIGIGCPGIIEADGSIERGAQNLPGNWESKKFNLPQSIRERIPRIGDHETNVVMHNDAVIQGLSQLPYLGARKHWGVLTIGTGLGNARFTNRRPKRKRKHKG
jgi:hypothetical protein